MDPSMYFNLPHLAADLELYLSLFITNGGGW